MSRIVHLSEASTIGLHSMIMIARAKGLMNVKQITEQTGASPNHLAKVMQRLVKGNIVRSVRGPAGGFKLKKPARSISVLDIYEAIEGPIETDECPMLQPTCPFEKCLVGTIVKKTTDNIVDYFKNQSLQDFI